MNENSTVVRFPQPEVVDDPLTEVLRAGARRLLAQAIEAEAEAFLAGISEQAVVPARVARTAATTKARVLRIVMLP